MIRLRRKARRALGGLCGAVAAAFCAAGCAQREIKPVRLENVALGPMTVAVAPAINVSGSADLEPNRAADLMASELSYVTGVDVIPVSRVLAVLADQGRYRVESPDHALKIAGRLGADAILVFAVTEYDPYDPPVVGITAQIYGRRRRPAAAGLDPVAASRRAAPAARPGADAPLALLASYEGVFDASHEWVCAEVRRFAESRTAEASPYGWRKYLASQQHYLRFCCHAVIRSLVGATHCSQATRTSG